MSYKDSTLGIFWIIMMPLVQLLVYVFVFNKVIPLEIDAYPAFLFTGLLPFTWFSSCLNKAGGLFTQNSDLMRKPNFAPIILIFVETLTNLLSYLLFLPILLILIALYGINITWVVMFLPLLVFIQAVLIIGLSLIIATLNVFYRDIQHIVGVVLRLLFFLTPVFYQPGKSLEGYSIIFNLNPIAVLIDANRSILIHGKAPEWDWMFLIITMSVVFLLIGYWIYNRKLQLVYDRI
ncbi:MAG: ABC transporter permease [Candidatus Scalindua sp.]|nr:ABC transporter permease [Candidatus Scalindua sp.]